MRVVDHEELMSLRAQPWVLSRSENVQPKIRASSRLMMPAHGSLPLKLTNEGRFRNRLAYPDLANVDFRNRKGLLWTNDLTWW